MYYPVEQKVLSVDLGALTRMLDRLLCKGWIERLPNPNDKRGVLVEANAGRRAQFVSNVINDGARPASGINKKLNGGRSGSSSICSRKFCRRQKEV